MKSLGIAIDGGRFVRIDLRTSDLSKNVRLRTLKAGQNTARLEFYAFRGKKHILKKTVKLEGLAGTDESPAEISLRIDRSSLSVWEIRIRKPNRTIETIKVRTGPGGALKLIAAMMLLLFLSSGIYFLLPVFQEKVFFSARTSGSPTGEADDFKTSRETEPADSGKNRIREDEGGVWNTREQSPEELPDTAINEGEGDLRTSDTEETEKEPNQTVPLPPSPLVVYFSAESAELTPMTKSLLNDYAKELQGDLFVDIGGHCADYGTERGRLLLSEARASAVAAYLGERIEPSVRLTAKGYGVSVPATNNPFRQDLNRRVELKAGWNE